MGHLFLRTLILLLLLPLSSYGAQYIPETTIPPTITRDSEINPTGDPNGICITNNPGVTPNIAFCSTVDFTSKTFRFKADVFTVAGRPTASTNTNRVIVVTDGLTSADCVTGGGSTRALCISNGTVWVALGGAGGGGGGGSGTVGPGTTNTIAIFTGPTTVGNSSALSEDATYVTSSKPIRTGSVFTSYGLIRCTVCSAPRNFELPDLAGNITVLGQSIPTTGLVNAARDKTANFVLTSPTTGDTNKLQVQFAAATTLIKVGCSTDTGTVTIQLDKRGETTPNTTGTNALTSSLVCDNNRQETTTFSSATIAANQVLNLQVTAVASSPTVVRIHVFTRLD